jgi:hypothetical protein
MKIIATLIALGVLARAAFAIDLAAPSVWSVPLDFKQAGRVGSFTLDVRETASSRKVVRNFETDYGSYDRDFITGKTIAIDISTTGNAAPPETTMAEVIWFAQDRATKKVSVYTRKGVVLTFVGRVAKATSDLPPIESNVTNYAALGQHYVEGQKLAGWLVCIRDVSGLVYRHRASTPAIEAIARGPGLQELIAEFEAWRAKL